MKTLSSSLAGAGGGASSSTSIVLFQGGGGYGPAVQPSAQANASAAVEPENTDKPVTGSYKQLFHRGHFLYGPEKKLVCLNRTNSTKELFECDELKLR